MGVSAQINGQKSFCGYHSIEYGGPEVDSTSPATFLTRALREQGPRIDGGPQAGEGWVEEWFKWETHQNDSAMSMSTFYSKLHVSLGS